MIWVLAFGKHNILASAVDEPQDFMQGQEFSDIFTEAQPPLYLRMLWAWVSTCLLRGPSESHQTLWGSGSSHRLLANFNQ